MPDYIFRRSIFEIFPGDKYFLTFMTILNYLQTGIGSRSDF